MKIGLIPMSAKPYHIGHHSLVEIASRENDRVLLFVSLSDRKRKGEFSILGSDMKRIWNDHIEKIIPTNVIIEYGGSPVRKVYETLGTAEIEKSQDVYTIYSDPEDTATNYPELNRFKYFPNLCKNDQIVLAAQETPEKFSRGVGTPDVSGAKLRSALEAGDREEFSKGMPKELDSNAVFDILSKDVFKSELLMRELIKLLI